MRLQECGDRGRTCGEEGGEEFAGAKEAGEGFKGGEKGVIFCWCGRVDWLMETRAGWGGVW